MAKLRDVLARAMGEARIDLGAGDPTQASKISVLPRPLASVEGRSLARPAYFDIGIRHGRCVLTRRDTGQIFALDEIPCRPLAR
ncbi:MAG TPA: hypothetical protein VG841_10360 [Caulobacterales bacterium]|nr:hypothetical protein [Caulobacterales bacterium]